jgi:hypothetical protein
MKRDGDSFREAPRFEAAASSRLVETVTRACVIDTLW